MAQGDKGASVNTIVVGSIQTRGNEIFKISLFDVKFYLLTRIASRIRRNVGNGSFLMEMLCLILGFHISSAYYVLDPG